MRSLSIVAVCIVAGGFAASPYAAQAQIREAELGWRPYVDERTGTRVDFPSALFPVDGGATERGIGRVFASDDGRAKFSAYTLENEESDTPRSYLRRFLKVNPSTIDYGA